jgi:CHAT domain-containing protein/Tfp pilus assembly protein PilF
MDKCFLVQDSGYKAYHPTTKVPHFDKLIAFSVEKTKGMVLDALAISEFYLGNIDRALQYSMEAVTVAQEVGDPQLLKIAYADLGYIHMCMGNYYSALELLHESLDIDKNSHDPWRKRNRVLSILSQLYYLVGQYENALESIQEALELSQKENDLVGETRCLNAKGVMLSNLTEYNEAKKCLLEALSLSKNELNNKTLQGLILANLSHVYWSISESEKARDCLESALGLSKQMNDKSTEANILASMAILDLEDENFEEAKRHAETSLEISTRIYSPSVQSDASFILGTIEDYTYKNPAKAYEFYKEAISISENLRNNLILDDFKISFFENYLSLYQQMISLCIRMDKTEEAFTYIEKSKSKALVDMLYHTLDEITPKTESNETIDEIRILKGKLDLLRKKLTLAYSSVFNENDCSDNGRQQEIEAAIMEELKELERVYRKIYQELKMKDPELSSLMSADVIGIEAVQDMVQKDKLLVQLYQTPEELIIMTIKKDKPPSIFKVQIDIEKESQRLYNLFSALSEGIDLDTRSHEYIKNIKQTLSYFYDLLILPITSELRGVNHLIIVPHFFWHYLPFHALYDNVSRQYLIDKFSISYAPSATALNYCLLKNRNQYKSALVLANPTNDLPFADREAETIKTKFVDNGYIFKGKSASFDKLPEYSQSDVIHLACHGYFRGDDPLFSHLILSDSEGKETPFFIPDIFNLRLNSSLVTLSACETGLSQFTAGDELIGISRAFFYAGAPSLLTSLWAVNDKSTALLMDRFYEGLVGMGENKSMALKSAVKKLKAIPEYSHPYFWASFFLSGDWR